MHIRPHHQLSRTWLRPRHIPVMTGIHSPLEAGSARSQATDWAKAGLSLAL